VGEPSQLLQIFGSRRSLYSSSERAAANATQQLVRGSKRPHAHKHVIAAALAHPNAERYRIVPHVECIDKVVVCLKVEVSSASGRGLDQSKLDELLVFQGQEKDTAAWIRKDVERKLCLMRVRSWKPCLGAN
jgi:hypothetical protein